MSGFKDQNFGDRLSAAAKAKQALLERFRSRPGPDDPAVRERDEARKAVAAAREARIAERKAQREAEAARIAAEEAARKAEEEARAKALEAEQNARVAALEAERKRARDARYAARKARKR
jgi:hypothetical protein